MQALLADCQSPTVLYFSASVSYSFMYFTFVVVRSGKRFVPFNIYTSLTLGFILAAITGITE